MYIDKLGLAINYIVISSDTNMAIASFVSYLDAKTFVNAQVCPAEYLIKRL